ncbi:MAG: DNA internalization-related competence protein ComEC/Rec2 [Candidatus Ventricola sp.]
MKKNAANKPPVVLPVRRRLMAATAAYLLGIFLTNVILLPAAYLLILCALLLAWAAVRLLQRKRALFCLLAFMLLLGNLRAGSALRRRDLPTAPGVRIEGTVKKILKPYRVMLEDVTVDGEAASSRPVVVTLMREEEPTAPPEEPLIGQRVQGTGRLFAPEEPRNPGGMNWRVRAICEGYELSGYLLPGWMAQGGERFSPGEQLRWLRGRIAACVEALFGGQAALFQGVMLGDKSALDSEISAAMRLTGTAHILTVSGLHLSMIAGVVSMLLGRAPVGRKTRFAVLSAFLVFFTGLTGAAPGTVRACIMAMLREYAAVRGRRYEPLTGLACAALLMTLAVPLWALNASFQFSFFVVLGIQLFSRSLTDLARRHLGALPERLLGMTALCVSAQLASLPMQLLLYGYVPLLALPMNLLCSALMPALLLGGWCVTLAGLLWPAMAALPAGLLSAAASGFERLSLWAASLDHAIVRLPAPRGACVLLLLALLLLLSSRIRYGRWRKQAACLLACAILLSYAPRLNPQARYVQLDVGQGDAALLASGRRAVLVDVGPADSYEMLRYLRREGLSVEAVILSHLDEDHAGALETLLSSEVEIPTVITSARAAQEECPLAVQAALEHMAREDIPLLEVQRGDRIAACGATLDVLSPDDTLSGSNERSLLLHARLEDVTFLLTGDLPQESEPDAVPAADVLKVAHHGSKGSTSDAFLDKAGPKLALISVGANNRYGHPTERVLKSLSRVGAQVLRTDENGSVTLWLRRGGYRIETCLQAAQ